MVISQTQTDTQLIKFSLPLAFVQGKAHITLPALSALNKLDKRVDIRSAATAARNDSVGHNRHRFLWARMKNH